MSQLYAGLILLLVLLIFTLGRLPLFRIDRTSAAVIGAAAVTATGVMSFDEAIRAVDFRTIIVLFAMMIIAANLRLAGCFEYLGHFILRRIKTRNSLLITVILCSGVLSAIAINDIVCLLFTPVVLLTAKQTDSPPVPYLLALAMASNIGSAATFIGNPQNILIGSLSGLPLADYLRVSLPLSLSGLLLTYIFLRLRYRSTLNGKLKITLSKPPYFHPYLLIKTLLTLAAVIVSYLLGCELAVAAVIGAAFLLVTRRIKAAKIYAGIDFTLLIIFMGLFIVIGGVSASGLLNTINALLPLDQLHQLPVFGLLTVILSNIVSNVPAVLLLQYYISPESAAKQWQALALLSTFAGNLTLFGSIANLIVAELAKKLNVTVSAREYFLTGCPLTIILCLLTVLYLQ